MLTFDQFTKFKEGEVFAMGEAQNTISGIHLTFEHYGRMLKWVAKKGAVNDFAVYAKWSDTSTFDDVTNVGEKVTCLHTVKRLINCDDEVLKHYRF